MVRINAGTNPTHRAYPFDPVARAIRDRVQIAEAACTVWQAYFAAGSPQIVQGDAGGFADFNRLCRQPVLFLTTQDLTDKLPWTLGDPAASMLADSTDADPDSEALHDLLLAMAELTEGLDVTSAEVKLWYDAGAHQMTGPRSALRSALHDIAGARADLSVRSIGRVLRHRRDRTVGGLKLLARGSGNHAKSWRVVHVQG